MASVAMTNDQRKQLVKILAESQVVLAIARRQNLLEDAGLDFFAPRLNFDLDPRAFAQQLVRELQDYGTFQGQPALVYLLRYLRDEVESGHEEKVTFLNQLLQSYPGNNSASTTPSVSPIGTTATTPNVSSILFLASNPTNTGRLRLEREYKLVREELERSAQKYPLAYEPGVSDNDLSRWLLRYKPTMVHFSGHGNVVAEGDAERGARLVEQEDVSQDALPSGIILENEQGKARLIPPEMLSRLFGMTSVKRVLKLVLLNACWGEGQAEALVKQAGIPIAIGMNHPIGDEAAIRFAQGFYRGLGDGLSVGECFDLGQIQMGLIGTRYTNVPVMLNRDDIDPYTYTL